MAEQSFDVVVIGGGPGGYIAAIRAAQLKQTVACVERDRLGGICLNWGCIPTKALLKNAEYINFLNHAADYGFGVKDVKVDFPKVIGRSRAVAEKMSKGVEFLFKKNKITRFAGSGFIAKPGVVQVKDAAGKVTDTITAKSIIVATGARARMIPGIEVDRKKIITSTEAMVVEKAPSSIVIIGAGAIGVEFAYFFRAFGSQVTIVEMMADLLPIEDADVSKELARSFRKAGIETLTETKVKSAKATGAGVEVVVELKSGEVKTLKADLALNAVGVQGNVENLGLEQLGVTMDRSFIKVDKFMQTNVKGIYAIGDVNGPPWLAHVASAEGVVAAERIAGHATDGMDYTNIPGCTYCQPQVASVGLTERKARELGHELKIGKFPFTANGKANGTGETAGFVKLIFDAKYGELLGAHIIGSEATEMIAEMALARALEATAETIMHTVHAHPTFSEAVKGAAEDAYGMALDI
jgi:dihydrolipoamide dehydrogenase